MTHCVPMKDCMELMHKMAHETRVRHSVDLYEVVFPYIERDHGIKIVYDTTWPTMPLEYSFESYIEFASESQYTMLMLKYL
jgi:hypothetical protein